MAHKNQKSVTIRHSEDGHTSGVLHLNQFDQSDRIRRALKGLGITWAIAAIGLLIPIAHWFIVPSLLIAGPIIGYFRYSVTDEKENAIGQCPHCKEESKFDLEANDHFPKWVHCGHCNAPLQLLDEKK